MGEILGLERFVMSCHVIVNSRGIIVMGSEEDPYCWQATHDHKEMFTQFGEGQQSNEEMEFHSLWPLVEEPNHAHYYAPDKDECISCGCTICGSTGE